MSHPDRQLSQLERFDQQSNKLWQRLSRSLYFNISLLVSQAGLALFLGIRNDFPYRDMNGWLKISTVIYYNLFLIYGRKLAQSGLRLNELDDEDNEIFRQDIHDYLRSMAGLMGIELGSYLIVESQINNLESLAFFGVILIMTGVIMLANQEMEYFNRKNSEPITTVDDLTLEPTPSESPEASVANQQ